MQIAPNIDNLFSAVSTFQVKNLLILDRIRFSLQICFDEEIKCKDRNEYRLPRGNKGEVSAHSYQ